MVVRGGGYTFELFRFADPGLRPELSQFGVRPLPGDHVSTYSFTLPNGRHYDGAAHVFGQGAQQQVCYRGAAYVDGGNSAAFIAHPRTAAVRLDGVIVGGRARMDVRVGSTHYYVFGQVQSRKAAKPQSRAPRRGWRLWTGDGLGSPHRTTASRHHGRA